MRRGSEVNENSQQNLRGAGRDGETSLARLLAGKRSSHPALRSRHLLPAVGHRCIAPSRRFTHGGDAHAGDSCPGHWGRAGPSLGSTYNRAVP